MKQLRLTRSHGSTTSLASSVKTAKTSSSISSNSSNSSTSSAHLCPSCERQHITQTVEGRYILADYLDQYLELRFKEYPCKVKRVSKLSKHVIVAPEKLHEKELSYLQDATHRGGLKAGFLVPIPGRTFT